MQYDQFGRRNKYEILRSQLEAERASFIPTWRDLGDYTLPTRPRFITSNANKGDRRNLKIFDATATMSLRTLSAGMMSGITNPARPWFRLTTPDPALAETGAVKEWLHAVTQRMSTVFLRCNLYTVLPYMYGDLGAFATAAMFVEEDLNDVVRYYPQPIGSYMIALNSRLKVDTFFREFRYTVDQLVKKFGKLDEKGQVTDWDCFSMHVRHQWEQGNRQTWVDVCHVVMPNDDYDPAREELGPYKKFISVYYEKGYSSQAAGNYMASENGAKCLSVMGYDLFPVLVPRWEVTGEDIYGTNCPGMTMLGDIKQLQLGVKRGAQAIEKMINPPMIAPTSLRNQKASIIAGDITFNDVREGQQGFRPAHEVNFRLDYLENMLEQLRKRIQRGFYEDLFLMLANDQRSNITAREIDERHEEKLLALGPVLEQFNQDFLDPNTDIVYSYMEKQGLIPEPPEELQNVPLKVEYISVMHQAQRMAGIGSLERFTNYVGNLVALTKNPEFLDKIDGDQLVDEYGNATSIPPRIIRDDEQVQEIRAGRAKAQQAAQMAETAERATAAARNLAGADMEGDNALTRLAEAGNLVPGPQAA